jgi:SAM-dependent methyltransferase
MSLSEAGKFDSEYYRTIYRNYGRQNPPRKMQFYRDLVLERFGEETKNPSILDVGCAFGVFLKSLPAEWRRYGIDISDYAIESAQAGASKSLEFAPAILETNPFKGPFDIITSFDVMEHIPDRETALDTIHGLLKPKGLFVFVVPVYDGPLGWLAHLLDKDPTHLHKVGRANWLKWVDRRFKIEKWLGAYRFLFPGGFYLHYPTSAFRAFSPAIAIVARKVD